MCIFCVKRLEAGFRDRHPPAVIPIFSTDCFAETGQRPMVIFPESSSVQSAPASDQHSASVLGIDHD